MCICLHDRIQSLATQVPDAGGVFKMVDFGCGPGVSSVETVRPAIASWRARDPDAQIVICHADQVGNDWNTLFQIASGPDGYLGEGNIRMEASVGSFYEQVSASNSVSLGTCIFASHWLSHAVELASGTAVWFADLQGQARQDLETLAQNDWTRFLKHRAAELCSGGYMVVGTLGSVPDSAEVNGVAASGRKLYRALERVAKSMVEDGLLSAKALENFVFSLWFMTRDEALRVLETDPDLHAAFEICEASVTPSGINPEDIFAAELSDPATYAEKYTHYIKAFADSSLRSQLFGPDDLDEETLDQRMEEFYNRLFQLYQTETNALACEIWHLILVLKKR